MTTIPAADFQRLGLVSVFLLHRSDEIHNAEDTEKSSGVDLSRPGCEYKHYDRENKTNDRGIYIQSLQFTLPLHIGVDGQRASPSSCCGLLCSLPSPHGKLVRQGGLPVVDMGDEAEVAYEHRPWLAI
ncbi:MAG: hypothetical protein JSU77_07930 [Fidelibacterota bacterium]|nr:MAG: hypothetical protein JSU77_07930 [Candidatus Neomarinimicrobiota bacterium]